MMTQLLCMTNMSNQKVVWDCALLPQRAMGYSLIAITMNHHTNITELNSQQTTLASA